MAQIKAQDVNWLDQAWRISAVIAAMPSHPRGGLLSDGKKWPPLTGEAKMLIELLQDAIALHLAYRLHIVHHHKKVLPDGAIGMFMFNDRNPATTLKSFASSLSDSGIQTSA